MWFVLSCVKLYFDLHPTTIFIPGTLVYCILCSAEFLSLCVLLTYFISFSLWPCSKNIWWLLTWPVSSTSLFLFLYVLTMTEFTHPCKHNHLYLTLSFGSQTHKTCHTSHLSILWAVMNIMWFYIMSVLSITAVISDQNIDTSHIRGKWFDICIFVYFYIEFCQPVVLLHLNIFYSISACTNTVNLNLILYAISSFPCSEQKYCRSIPG